MKRKKLANETTDNQDIENIVTENSITKRNERQLFLKALVVRCLSVLLTQTYFVPDEYWQSTEVAHYHVFGYGYLTWEWHQKIRSYLHPFIFEIFLTILKWLHIDLASLIIYGPHFIQAFITALSDVMVFRIALKLFNDYTIAWYSYMLHLMSWFIFYTGSRTLSNTLEMNLIIIALAFIKTNDNDSKKHYKNTDQNSLFLLLFFGGVSLIIRPTAIIPWAYIMFNQLLITKTYTIKELFVCSFKVLPLLVLLLFGVDYYFYKEFVFVPWNFYKFNVADNLSEFYGTHPFHWYVSQGLPVTLFTHVIFVCFGVYYGKQRFLFYAATLYVVVLSLIDHKEFRFLLPSLSLFTIYAGLGFTKFCIRFELSWKKTFLVTLISNVILSIYFCMVHQRGVIDAVHYVRDNAANNSSILFLMPCHSTPFHSYMHRQNITMDILTCLPNSQPHYEDEADRFYNKPLEWFSTHQDIVMKTTHVIAFNVLPEITSYFHTHLPEGRIGSHVDIFTKYTSATE